MQYEEFSIQGFTLNPKGGFNFRTWVNTDRVPDILGVTIFNFEHDKIKNTLSFTARIHKSLTVSFQSNDPQKWFSINKATGERIFSQNDLQLCVVNYCRTTGTFKSVPTLDVQKGQTFNSLHELFSDKRPVIDPTIIKAISSDVCYSDENPGIDVTTIDGRQTTIHFPGVLNKSEIINFFHSTENITINDLKLFIRDSLHIAVQKRYYDAASNSLATFAGLVGYPAKVNNVGSNNASVGYPAKVAEAFNAGVYDAIAEAAKRTNVTMAVPGNRLGKTHHIDNLRLTGKANNGLMTMIATKVRPPSSDFVILSNPRTLEQNFNVFDSIKPLSFSWHDPSMLKDKMIPRGVYTFIDCEYPPRFTQISQPVIKKENEMTTINLSTLVALAQPTHSDEFTQKATSIASGRLGEKIQFLLERKEDEKIDAAAATIVNLLKLSDDAISNSVDRIREARQLIAAEKAKIEQIEMASAFGSETMNYLPLLKATACNHMTQETKVVDLAKIPEDFEKKYKVSKVKEGNPVVTKKTTVKKPSKISK